MRGFLRVTCRAGRAFRIGRAMWRTFRFPIVRNFFPALRFAIAGRFAVWTLLTLRETDFFLLTRFVTLRFAKVTPPDTLTYYGYLKLFGIIPPWTLSLCVI